MKALFADASRTAWLGGAIAAAAFLCWISIGPDDVLGLVSFVARFVHVGSAMLWVGMIWFVNFIQLVALREASETERGVLLTRIVPRVTALFSSTSHLVVVSGVVLLLTTGYLLDRWVFPSAVYVPSGRALLIWAGVAGGLVMWWLVHGVVRPNLAVVIEGRSGEATIAEARERVLLAARINLLLAVPVTFAMIGAAHLV